MRGFKQIILLIIGFLIVSGGIFAYGFRENLRLKNTLRQKEKKLKQAHVVQRNIKQVQKEAIQLKLKATRITKQIPTGNKQRLELMRKLTQLGTEHGLKNIRFVFGQKQEGPSGQPATGGPMSPGPQRGEPSPPKKPSGQQAGPPSQEGEGVQASATDSLQVKPVFLTMNFECEFPQLVTFLQRTFKMHRILTIQNLKIERVKNILPRQKITLKIAAYTFPSS